MEYGKRNESLAELRAEGEKKTWAIVGCVVVMVCMAIKMLSQTEIIIVQTPGMPANSIIERTSFDKGAQVATLNAVTSNLAQITPANAEYQKQFLQAYLSPQVYTKISSEIDLKVEKAKLERELGSFYFVLKRYEYDPQLNKHFVVGEQHTVNAAKDTAQDYVYEYDAHVENYRLWIDDLKTYPGDKPHNTEWIEANKK
jgi:TraE protein